MINREKHARQLPDGTYVTGSLTAAAEYGATLPAFLAAAKKAGLKRYASRTAKGQVGHWWIVDEVEELKRQRFGAAVALEGSEDDNPFVEAPYDTEAN